MSPERLEEFKKDSLLHKLQDKDDRIKKLVEKYPNNMMLGEKIRELILNENEDI